MALSIADSYPLMLIYAVGSGLGFGLTGLAVTMLLLDYFGRRHNLEIFSLTCLVGAFSALGPSLGGLLRDSTGAFGLDLPDLRRGHRRGIRGRAAHASTRGADRGRGGRVRE